MPKSTTQTYKADILAIDDTPENLQLLSQLLTKRQYKVRSVTKGTTALRAAQAAAPDLILLDINMPGMSGYEVCEHLKQDERTREIPVIFISALGETLDKVRAFQVGGVDFVTKPFQVEEVLARIETHLQLCFLRQQLQEQNQALQTAIRSRERAQETFTKAFRSSPSPIVITTLETGRFLEVNDSFLRLSGYSRREIIDQTVSDLNLGISFQDYIEGVIQLEQNRVIQNQEFDLRTKTGDYRTLLLSVELIELEGHRCALSIGSDITQRKRLENEFISLVSHELKTPMNAMIGALDLVGTGELGMLNEKGQHLVNMAVSNAERLVRLVNDVLDLERMKSGQLSRCPGICRLPNLFEQAAAVMQPMAQAADVELVVKPVDVEVRVDCDRIQQLLTNLLSNAIKFSSAHQTVWLTAELQQSVSPQLLLTVRDQGRGIPEDKLNLIFERFQQVDVSDTRQKGGTGLGLAICHQIVRQHQGRIWAESCVGNGSTFNVLLPLGKDA
ncbi:MAG: ATP-binding protein [Leptolyngbyaceae cyanobacterium]